MILLNSVLVATDFGDASDAALAYGRDMARTFGARLHVLHVAENVAATAAAEYYPALLTDLQKEVEGSARARLDTLLTPEDRTKLGAKPVTRVSAAVADAIVAYAREAHINLIIVGTHGRGPVAHFFLGSVAERVVRTAPCPVLTVRRHEREPIEPKAATAAARIS